MKMYSLLHHKGISEEMFSYASTYKCGPSSPSEEELEQPQKFLAPFLDHIVFWDPLCFKDITNEIRGNSLMNNDSGRKLFSIHPLNYILMSRGISLFHGCPAGHVNSKNTSHRYGSG
jgi:hypothetical protein